MKKFLVLLVAVIMCGAVANAQTEDDVVINEFAVNPATGKEYIEILVVGNNVDLQGWTLSDVSTRAGTTGATEGDITLPASASYLSSVARGTYIVIELTTPGANVSTLAEDLDPTGDRTIIIKTTTAGVTTGGTSDNATSDNIQIYAGTRASGTLIDEVLCGSNTSSYIIGATWGDNSGATTSDNINGGTAIPSGSSVRFVPTDQTSPLGFQDNDTGVKFVVDAASYGTPGTVNTGVNDNGGNLPVELTSFTAIARGKNVELKWNTATEVNNVGFEVEKNVSGKWSKIGFVEGNGTTNAPKSYSYADANVIGTVSYRLKQIDRDGQFEYSGVVEATVADIKTFGLDQNYPNPFNPVTMINYQLPMNSSVTLKVYDALGREVAMLVNEVKEAGSYSATFDGSKLSSGIYFYTLQSGNFTATKKLTLMK